MYQHPDKMRERASGLVSRSGYAAGGHKLGPTEDSDYAQDVKMIAKGVHEHEANMHKGEPKTRLKLASGGMADQRLDRSSRKAHRPGSQVNVVITPPAHPPMGGLPPGGMMPRPPMPAPMPPRPAGPPPAPPGGVAAPMAGPMPNGVPPGMPPVAPRPFKDGGNVGKAGAGSPEMTAGAGGGRGRLEKVARQGLSPEGR